MGKYGKRIGGLRPPPLWNLLWMAMKLFGYEVIRLLVAHGPWSVNFVDSQQYLFFSFRPHIMVHVLAFDSIAKTTISQKSVFSRIWKLIFDVFLELCQQLVCFCCCPGDRFESRWVLIKKPDRDSGTVVENYTEFGIPDTPATSCFRIVEC